MIVDQVTRSLWKPTVDKIIWEIPDTETHQPNWLGKREGSSSAGNLTIPLVRLFDDASGVVGFTLSRSIPGEGLYRETLCSCRNIFRCQDFSDKHRSHISAGAVLGVRIWAGKVKALVSIRSSRGHKDPTNISRSWYSHIYRGSRMFH